MSPVLEEQYDLANQAWQGASSRRAELRKQHTLFQQERVTLHQAYRLLDTMLITLEKGDRAQKRNVVATFVAQNVVYPGYAELTWTFRHEFSMLPFPGAEQEAYGTQYQERALRRWKILHDWCNGRRAMRILVVEDDPHLGPALKARLESHHHATDLFTDGADGLAAALTTAYDLLIIDVLLPGVDGFTLCRELRARRVTTPLLLLTALGEVEQRVTGLDAGADDYLGKPFAFAELDARVRALLRRGSQDKAAVVRVGDLTLDTRTHAVHRSGRVIALTGKEYALLDYLMRHPGYVLSRAQLVEHVWDFATDHLSNVLEVFIAHLRRKLGEPDLIHTVRGSGYQLRPPEAS